MILERYLIRTLVLTAGASLLGLVVVLVAVHLAEQAGGLTREAGALAIMKISALHGVVQAYQMLPLAGFFATLITGAVLARRGELLAIHGSGMHPRRLWGACVVVVTALAALGVGWGELAVPNASVAIERLYQSELNKGPGRLNAFFARRHYWFSFDDLILYLPYASDDHEPVFRAPVVYRFADGLVAEVIEATELRHDSRGWLLTDARTFPTSGKPSRLQAELHLTLAASPQDLTDVAGNPRQMGARDLWRLIGRRSRAGFDTRVHWVELHARVAHPLLGLFLFVLVAPWMLSPVRRRSLAVALGGGVVVIALAVAMGQVFRLLALGAKIPAFFGAWGVHLTCLLLAPIAVWVYRRTRR